MGCCYVYKLEEIHTILVPAVVDVYCADLAACLIAQGYDAKCVDKNAGNPEPVGTATVHMECEVIVTKYTTVTTEADCGDPPPPPGPGWDYAGKRYPCQYGGESTAVMNPEGAFWSWKIDPSTCISRAVFNDPQGMLNNILSKCLLDCPVVEPVDMEELESCYSASLTEAMGEAYGGLLVCNRCTVGGV